MIHWINASKNAVIFAMAITFASGCFGNKLVIECIGIGVLLSLITVFAVFISWIFATE